MNEPITVEEYYNNKLLGSAKLVRPNGSKVGIQSIWKNDDSVNDPTTPDDYLIRCRDGYTYPLGAQEKIILVS